MSELLAHLPPIEPAIALMTGILILITPRMLHVLLAFYLIVVGAKGLGVF